MPRLTKKQRAVYDFVDNFIKEKGYSPSYRDISAGLGLSSVASVAEHINNLVALGALKKSDGSAHSLEVIDFTHPETVALFKNKLLELSVAEDKAKDIETLKRAAVILDLDLEEEQA